MSSAPTTELRDLWLSAVLLPDETDPRASCIRELAEYTGLPEAEVERRCEGAVDDQRDQWYEGDRSTPEGLIDFYNDCDAYLYELLWWHALEQGEAPAWNARLLTLAREEKTKRYLDFGAGIGTNSILLAGEGIEVELADVSDVMQKFAKWRLERRGIAAHYIDLKTTALEPQRYDMISAVDVLEHVPDPLETLEQITNALVPGGLLVFDLIASKPDAERPFHLLRSKYPIRSRIRGLGYSLVESFQKYLVYRKSGRSPFSNQLIGGWDRLRWRTYYLLQGQWPRATAPVSKDGAGSSQSNGSR